MDSFNFFVKEEKPGLYANIHAKRARIKAGSGEKMRKPGSEGAPTPQDFKDAAKTAKEEYSLDEAVSVKKQNYSWGKMVTVHHGSETSYPLHPEHQAKIKALGDGEKTSFKDETKRTVTAHRSGDTIHLSGAGTSKKTPVARSHFAEEVSPMIKAPKNEFATKADAFAHAKEKGGKVMKKTFTHPTTGQQHVSYVVKEEVEEIDELSRDTISSYKNKASDARLNKNLPTAKVDKRMSGVAKASARLDKKNVEEEQKYYSIVHKTTKKVLSTHKDMASAKDEHRGMDLGVRAHYYVATSTKEPRTFNMKEAKEKDAPFTPDAPKKTAGAKPGKYGSEYSRVRHLARMALKQKQKRTNEDVKINEEIGYSPREHRLLANKHFNKAKKLYQKADSAENRGDSYGADHLNDIAGKHATAYRAHEKASTDPKYSGEAHKASKEANDMIESVELDEGRYGSFRVRTTSGTGAFGGPKLPRRPYAHQGDTDPRTGLPLGFYNPPEKSEKPEDKKMKKEEVEQVDELKKSTLASYAKKAVKNVAGRERWQGDEEGRYDGYDEDEHKKEDEKLAKRKKNIDRAVDRLAKEEFELDEAMRHKVAGAVAQFIGNKIDPVHGEIMRVHGEEAYRQAAYHIRKTLHGLHKALKNHLESGKLQTEEVNQVDEVLDSPGKAMGYLTKATISGLLDKGKYRKRQAGIKKAVDKTKAKINSEEVEVNEVKVKMPKPTKAYKEYTRLTGKTPEQRTSEIDKIQKDLEKQRQEYIKQGIIKA